MSSTHQLPNACVLNEDCARCLKGLKRQGVDCEELETQEGCNASLYTGDTVPGEHADEKHIYVVIVITQMNKK